MLLNGSLNQNDYRLASIKGQAKQLISSAFVVVILKWSAEVLYLLHLRLLENKENENVVYQHFKL